MEDFQKDALITFFRAAGQPERLKILGLVATRPHTPTELAEALDIKETAVAHHLRRLQHAGLVREEMEAFGMRYRLRPEYLEEMGSIVVDGEELDSFADRVLDKYLRHGKYLRTIPRDDAERAVVLRWLAAKFAPRKRYSESAVSAIISRHFHKQEMLRRYLLDTGLLKRTGGVYWRSGWAEEENNVSESV